LSDPRDCPARDPRAPSWLVSPSLRARARIPRRPAWAPRAGARTRREYARGDEARLALHHDPRRDRLQVDAGLRPPARRGRARALAARAARQGPRLLAPV